MSLQDLPPEVLTIIVRYLGPSHFRSNLRHLTLCKKWLPVALDQLQIEIHITLDNVRKLYDLKYENADPRQAWSLWSTQQTRSILVDIGVADEVDPETFEGMFNTLQYRLSSTVDKLIQQVHQNARVLTHFTRSLRQMTRLEVLRVTVLTDTDHEHGDYSPQFDRWVGPWSVVARQMLVTLNMAAPPALARIDLDLQGVGFFNVRSDDGYRESALEGALDRPHLCTAVNDIFHHHSQLRDVRPRLASICTEALNPHGLGLASLPLETLVINVSLCGLTGPRCDKCGPVSWPCFDGSRPSMDGIEIFHWPIKDAAAEFTKLMRQPKLVRVLGLDLAEQSPVCSWHIAHDTRGRIIEYAYDCLTGNQYKLPFGDDDWAREGTLVEGPEA